ncbi:TRAP transporter small permease [Phaeobacter gallaeciensis]|uniref:TRAP transporter small permease protein n=1 Tax=Phaeobacter gallaeciensis TaxID=60890 RepID=A0AAC9Z6Z3_9RHOB|nr:TRAP transporter small permease [Phaeobacter gallaeciensis]AHD09103.1 TRAP-type C4-dicarboxylate transport system, small permease component [Phaeobacter gallaeciensis DSM 26640]ATE92366.1 TRAP transporter, subunit DctQ [Phaeobacter gallaeciensis]ATE97812.1 TRAP transporter, subunit DctQ [Phaeobacter gallaeciensis]ATF01031.1 TRAP transporter, subunit DctQ [Phaeobacter gallaeciensis]ATF05411.1 TRAP transporter, subunit DctQ [Phaeobacter gallaeciensis]
MAGAKPGPTGLINTLEETLIALLLGLMTLITFANVVARFVFNSNILWALELTVFLFAWLVLLGASYAVKVHAHLGVDAILNMVSPGARRVIGLISVGCCLVFSLLLLKGAYDYWAVFADLPPTSGRWFPTGFDMKARSQSFYEVQDVPMVSFLRFLEDLINYGDSYEKLPKVVPYVVLPLSMLLMVLRFVQAGLQILRGDVDRLVASHEVEDEIAEVQAQRGEHD